MTKQEIFDKIAESLGDVEKYKKSTEAYTGWFIPDAAVQASGISESDWKIAGFVRKENNYKGNLLVSWNFYNKEGFKPKETNFSKVGGYPKKDDKIIVKQVLFKGAVDLMIHNSLDEKRAVESVLAAWNLIKNEEI